VTRHPALAGTFLALLTVVLIPFTLVSPLPPSDYPDHVARIQIIAHLSESAALSRHYLVRWESIPNLAMDLLVPMLMPPLSAGQTSLVFAALALFLVASGVIVAVICGGNFAHPADPPLDHVPNMAMVTKKAYLNTLSAEPDKQVLQVVYGSKAPFPVDPSQTFRMGPEEKGKAYPFPDIALKRFAFVMLINPDYFSHDDPARFAPIYEKENVMLFKVRPQKGS
jgi:hypothetical protein